MAAVSPWVIPDTIVGHLSEMIASTIIAKAMAGDIFAARARRSLAPPFLE